jgi:hypothetical protein
MRIIPELRAMPIGVLGSTHQNGSAEAELTNVTTKLRNARTD